MAEKHNQNSPTVHVTKTVSVFPKLLHPDKVLNLSNLDRQCPMLMYLVFFYKPCTSYINLSVESVFSSLKSGLEETLTDWYPAAGRLTLNPDGGKLDLWCNNKGAVMVEATTNVNISELGDLSQYNEFFENLVFQPVFNGDFSQIPLVVAQVTRFGCGGYSIGIGECHSLFDGPATYNFLLAWASNSAILKEKRSPNQPKPLHERGRLLVSNYHSQKGISSLPSSPNMGVGAAAAIDHLYQLMKQAVINPSCSTDPKLGAPAGKYIHELGNSNLVLKTFNLSGPMIEKLKSKVFGERRDSFSCSSFELVATHLWKARTKALGLQKGTVVCLQFAVDIRNKVMPPLPQGFSGNGYVLASAALTAKELEEGSHVAIIEKIKEAKNSIDSNYVHAYIQALDGSPGSLPPLKELTMVSDWTRMPFHKLDFLRGEAAYATPLVTPMPLAAYFMQNPIDSRGIVIRIGLFPEILNAFSHYFLTTMQ